MFDLMIVPMRIPNLIADFVPNGVLMTAKLLERPSFMCNFEL